MRKDLAQRLLRELLKNSKRSDRELAEILGDIDGDGDPADFYIFSGNYGKTI